MASMRHEGLLLLFRNRPELAPELLRDALGVGLPAYTEARIESAELTARDEDKRKSSPSRRLAHDSSLLSSSL